MESSGKSVHGPFLTAGTHTPVVKGTELRFTPQWSRLRRAFYLVPGSIFNNRADRSLTGPVMASRWSHQSLSNEDLVTCVNLNG